MTVLTLIRHAHVSTGEVRRLCGWFDLPLSETGDAQIRAFRPDPAHRPDALYTSTLVRARTTAAVLGRWWGLSPVQDGDLREIHCGRFEGVAIETIVRDHAALWSRNLDQTDDDFEWPGGESYRRFRSRVLLALARIADAHPGQRIAVVTHAGVVSQVVGGMHGLAAAQWGVYRPDPLTATDVEWNGGPCRLRRFSQPV